MAKLDNRKRLYNVHLCCESDIRMSKSSPDALFNVFVTVHMFSVDSHASAIRRPTLDDY
jgi:hypothetical protein